MRRSSISDRSHAEGRPGEETGRRQPDARVPFRQTIGRANHRQGSAKAESVSSGRRSPALSEAPARTAYGPRREAAKLSGVCTLVEARELVLRSLRLIEAPSRRGGRAVECTALEMRHACKGIGGSNPPLSANHHSHIRDLSAIVSQLMSPLWASIAACKRGAMPTAHLCLARKEPTETQRGRSHRARLSSGRIASSERLPNLFFADL